MADQRPLILGLGIAFPIVAIASVAARFHARKVKGVVYGPDDWTILVALIFCIGVCVDITLDAMLGNLGWHLDFDANGIPIFNSTYIAFGKLTFGAEVLIWPAVGLTKISVLLLYTRIFGTGKRFRTLTRSMMAFVVVWTIAFTIAFTFHCIPIESHWNPTILSKCVDRPALFTWALATDVVTHGMILLLPIYNVWKLHLPIMRKISIIGIFMLGGLVTITGIIRIHYLTLVFSALTKKRFNDIAYSYAPPFYWSIVETCTGIMCACLPTMMPLLEKYRVKTLGSRLLSSFGISSTSRSNVTHSAGSKRGYGSPQLEDKNNNAKPRFSHDVLNTDSMNDTSSFDSTDLPEFRLPRQGI